MRIKSRFYFAARHTELRRKGRAVFRIETFSMLAPQQPAASGGQRDDLIGDLFHQQFLL